ncbi:hypothetical protein Poli38472_000933 [Pythium oligandrum]|uniref:Retrotransposon gag domain-containing protein n=1 Tax=Pythium oligandrum TaxID=41045 RepID=A0A8K1CCM1_PYTOL|nr:hypothetical protein Poli38472_000933 [Pythium oligandrum]|eukprot:TMW60891.1 hypothetical protein Poli38472_000933 [Pythium oligandrum]
MKKLYADFKKLEKTPSMSVEKYATEFNSLLRLEGKMPAQEGQRMDLIKQCQRFQRGMPDEWTRHVLKRKAYHEWSSLDELKQAYLCLERATELKKMREKKQAKSPSQAPQKNNGKRKANRDRQCFYCKAHNHVHWNHNDCECFRNPSSPHYKPKPNAGSVVGHSAQKGTPRPNKRMKKSTTASNEDADEAAASRFYQVADDVEEADGSD